MGNSLGGIRLLNKGDCSYHVQLGKSAAIDLTERQVKQNGSQFTETWKASYTIDGSTCVLSITKFREVGLNNGGLLNISLRDDIFASGRLIVLAHTDSAGLLDARIINLRISNETMSYKTSKTRGGVTETSVYLYGHGTRRGLFVLERKKMNIMDVNPYMVTVAHYFATNIENVFNKTDIGLSVIAKIRPSDDGSMDFAVEGPVQHPAAALFYMFDEVFRTGLWKPTACPHCDNNSIIQRQGSIFWQSESEDSDNLPATRPHSRRQSAASVLGNDGVINGNHNGNLTVNRLSLRGR